MSEPKLPFPTKPLLINSRTVQEYIIPEEKRKQVLEQLYPFEDVPDLDELCYDIHEGKAFKVREYRVTREDNMNYLVSPYYPHSGGTVIDWIPASNA